MIIYRIDTSCLPSKQSFKNAIVISNESATWKIFTKEIFESLFGDLDFKDEMIVGIERTVLPILVSWVAQYWKG